MKMRVLSDRNVRVLLAGQSVNMLGNTAMTIVLGIWVKNLTGSSAAAGLIFLLFAATAFLAPVTGLLADRVPRRLLLIVNDTVTAAAIGLLLFVHSRRDIWLIYLVAGIYGLSGLIYRAARGGLLHSMVPDELLGEANGLFSSLSQGTRIFGPVIGAGIYTAWGGNVVAVADIATFAFSIGAYVALRQVNDLPWGAKAGQDEEGAAAGPGRKRPRFGEEAMAGARHVFGNPVIRRMIVASTIAFAGAGMIDVAIFSLVDQGLHRSTALIGVLTSIEGAGSVLAGVLVGPVMRRYGEYSIACAGFLLNGAGLAAAATATLSGAVIGDFLIGAGVPLVLVAELTILQRRTPAELQGRAISASEAIINTPFAIAIAIGAALIGVVGFRPIYIGTAIAFTLVGLWLMPHLKVTYPSGEATGPEPAQISATAGLAAPEPAPIAEPQP